AAARPHVGGMGVLTAGPGHRPGARARARHHLRAGTLEARAPGGTRRAPLRSRACRSRSRMTFAEARALFPVLERVAYLNAGTFGPLARPTVDVIVEQAR